MYQPSKSWLVFKLIIRLNFGTFVHYRVNNNDQVQEVLELNADSMTLGTLNKVVKICENSHFYHQFRVCILNYINWDFLL